MLWIWSTIPVSLTPDGGGIFGGSVIVADCIGLSAYTHSCNPSLTFGAVASATNVSIGVAAQDGYNIRDCFGISSNVGLCDVGNGLTIVKGITEYRNMNTLEFQGSANLSGGIYGKAILNILAGGDVATPYATRIDFVGDTTLYKAEAAVGSAESSAVWRIAKYTFAIDGDTAVLWAGGSDSFTNDWTNHLTHSYS